MSAVAAEPFSPKRATIRSGPPGMFCVATKSKAGRLTAAPGSSLSNFNPPVAERVIRACPLTEVPSLNSMVPSCLIRRRNDVSAPVASTHWR